VITILTLLGVETKTALAGVGIGGIAIALGAQKTVENLLGGIFLLGDRALAVGDTCTIGSRQGVVEDITLRSVRLRTLEQTLLSIPAGTLSQSNVENLSARGKILIQSSCACAMARARNRSGRSLRPSVGSWRRTPGSSWSRHVRGCRIQRSRNRARAVRVRADPRCRAVPAGPGGAAAAIATIVESSGTGFAQPTQYVYMDREAGVEAPLRDDVRVPRPGDTLVPIEPARSRDARRRT